MAKWSEISTTNQQTPQNTPTLKAPPQKTVKNPSFALARRIYTRITDTKKLALKNYTPPYNREDTQQD